MSDPTVEFLRECFEVDAALGRLTWRRRPVDHFFDTGGWNRTNGRCAGRLVEGEINKGYLLVRMVVRGRKIRLRAHRVVWALHYGRWPEGELDHIDRDKLNNRIGNLREATRVLQGQNGVHLTGVTGLTGAYPNGHGFCSRIKVKGKDVYLGQFATAEEAAAAYRAAKAQYHD